MTISFPSALREIEQEPFSAILFDCDGTLVDTIPAHLAALKQAMQRDGVSMEDAWFYRHHSMAADDFLDFFEQDGQGTIPDHGRVLREHQRLFREKTDLMEEIAVISGIARRWKGKVPLAVASNGHRENVIVSLEATGLMPLFDAVVTREDVMHGKPAPDLYLEAARRVGVPAAACIVFEDSDAGIASARAAGALAVDVRAWHTPAWAAAAH